MVNKRKLNSDKIKLKKLEKECISLNSFLVKYLGVRDNNILSNKISHRDIKVLFPDLVRASFANILDNPDLVYQGDVFLVEDSFGNIIPYYDPCYVDEDIDYYGDFTVEVCIEVIPNPEEMDLSSMSNYELQNLLQLYKKHNMRGAARKVKKELIFRKDSSHASGVSRHRVLKKARKNERFDY